MVYKLNYACSKKRLNDLIHKGLMYEKEHNIEQPEKETIRSHLIEENSKLKECINKMEQGCQAVANLTFDCNPYYCVLKLNEKIEKIKNDLKEVIKICESEERK